MNIFYGIYTLLNIVLVSTGMPLFILYSRLKGKHESNFKERLGCISSRVLSRVKGSPVIWVHAVSLGEVRVAGSLVNSLKFAIPGCSIIVSTATAHGRKQAEEILGRDIPVIYGPLDCFFSVRKVLKKIRPDVIVFLETEIWPAWITEARRSGTGTALINGRISPRSFRQYIKFRPFFRQVLKNVDVFSMISEMDGFRLRSIGGDPCRISVNGNAKYDNLFDNIDETVRKDMRKRLRLKPSDRIIIAGSTRTGEEEILLRAYEHIIRKFPLTILVIAPRHLERVSEISSLLEGRGLKYQLLSRMDNQKSGRRENILIVDTYGDLFNIYGTGTVAFCGASLIPLGGQNPLEPAAWGVPVLFGPHMEDFLDAKALLEKYKGAETVTGDEDMAEKIIYLFEHESMRKERGENAQRALKENQGSSFRHTRVISELLEKRKTGGKNGCR